MQPLITDAARPLKRSLHVEPLKLVDNERTSFEVAIPGPAVLRGAYARPFTQKQRVIGAPKREGILVVLTFEIDPDAAPIARTYYLLPLGTVAEGVAIGSMSFECLAVMPNGAPIAVYDATVQR